jgi:hypothetical protein
MSSPENGRLEADQDNTSIQAGWEAAMREFQHQATHLESRGALRAAVTLYDAIRIARAGGLNCEHQTRI